MNNNIKRKILQYETLKVELEDTEILAKEYAEKFQSEVCANFSFDIEPPKNQCNRSKPDEIPDLTENFNKIYKKLSLKLHPDRNQNLQGEEKQEIDDLFKEITQSKENGDLCNLLVRAREFRVKIPELLDTDIKILDINIKQIKERIEKMKGDPSWLWYTTDDDRIKDKIKKLVREIIEKNISFEWTLEEKIQCPICLDDMNVGDIERKILCGHIFHKACILSWFQIKFSCPMCRQAFN